LRHYRKGVHNCAKDRGVIGAQMAGYGFGIPRLIQGCIFESNRECANCPRGLLLHQRCHKAGVDSAGEEASQGYISEGLPGHGFGKRSLQCVERSLGLIQRVRQPGVVDRIEAPPRARRGQLTDYPTAERQGQQMAWWELADTGIDAERCWHVAEPQQRVCRLAIQLTGKSWVGCERGQF
jgi:hypothetical protein